MIFQTQTQAELDGKGAFKGHRGYIFLGMHAIYMTPDLYPTTTLAIEAVEDQFVTRLRELFPSPKGVQ